MVTLREAGGAAGAFTLALLLSFGISALPSDTHVCPENGVTMECARLSGTGVTCYPNIEDNVGYKRCSAGWEAIDRSVVEPDPEGEQCAETERSRVCVYRK